MGPKRAAEKAVEIQVQKENEKCLFCQRSKLSGNELEQGGKFFKLGNKFFHFFCVLFSHNVKQRGEDEEGLFGFFLQDILPGINKAKLKQCCYCNLNGAGSHCRKCSKAFHFVCGLENQAAFVFSKAESFCDSHVPQQKNRKIGVEDKTCAAGCLEEIKHNERFMVSHCCRKGYHLECLQQMALQYGNDHFKCPICGYNKKDLDSIRKRNHFLEECKKMGIYIPVKDATWETREDESFYNFEQMRVEYQTCEASKCLCPDGRLSNNKGAIFELIACDHCGGKAIHVKCGKLLRRAPLFVCNDHEGAAEKMSLHKRVFIKRLREENLLSDDEDLDSENSSSEDSAVPTQNELHSLISANAGPSPSSVREPFATLSNSMILEGSKSSISAISNTAISATSNAAISALSNNSRLLAHERRRSNKRKSENLTRLSPQAAAQNDSSCDVIDLSDDPDTDFCVKQTDLDPVRLAKSQKLDHLQDLGAIFKTTPKVPKSSPAPPPSSSTSTNNTTPTLIDLLSSSESEEDSEMEQKEERFRKRFWIKNRQDRLTMEAEKDKLKKELMKIFKTNRHADPNNASTSVGVDVDYFLDRNFTFVDLETEKSIPLLNKNENFLLNATGSGNDMTNIAGNGYNQNSFQINACQSLNERLTGSESMVTLSLSSPRSLISAASAKPLMSVAPLTSSDILLKKLPPGWSMEQIDAPTDEPKLPQLGPAFSIHEFSFEKLEPTIDLVIFKYLNADETCVLNHCRNYRASLASEDRPAKAEMRPQDFKALGLNPLPEQYMCTKHFTHDQPHLANQSDYFEEHGHLAPGAYLKKIYSKTSLKKKLLKSPKNYRKIFLGQEIVVCQEPVQDDHGVGPMQPLQERDQDSLEIKMEHDAKHWEHDYSLTIDYY